MYGNHRPPTQLCCVLCVDLPAQQWFVIFREKGDSLPFMSSSASPTCGKERDDTTPD